MTSLESPDASYTFYLETQESLIYSVNWKEQSIIEKSALGFELSDYSVLPEAAEVAYVERLSKLIEWQPVYGERNVYSDHYNEVLVQLSCETFNGRLALRVRAYNEGVAFRYEINSENELQVYQELTEFAYTPSQKLKSRNYLNYPLLLRGPYWLN